MIFRILIIIALFIASCGVKGNPKPPPSNVPSPITKLYAKQYGENIIIYFQYIPTYKDGRNIEKPINFKIYKDNKPFDTKIFNNQSYYWFFDSISQKESCYTVVVETEKDESQSKPVCFKGKKIETQEPKGLNIDILEEGLKISIDTDTPLYLYKVEKEDAFIPITYKKLTTKEYIDKDVQLNKTYCYYYTIIKDDIESQKSQTVCKTFKDIFPPLPPENGKLIIENGNATIVFDESKSKDVVGYIFFKNGKKINDIPIKTYYFEDKDYKPGDTYKVVAVDVGGNLSNPLEIR